MLKVLSPALYLFKKLPLLIIGILFISGCAHQNYIDEGKRFIHSNKYEAAVEQFTLALQEKPNDVNTQNNLTVAKKELHSWALALTPKADAAFHANHLGKALLLYGKSAQITKDAHSIKRYKEVYSILRSRSIVNANIKANNLGFNNSTFSSIDGIVTHRSAKNSLSFSQSNPIFEIQQSTQDAVTQYISGTQLIANPELVDLQHQLQHVTSQKRAYRLKMKKLTNNQSKEQASIHKLSTQLQRVDRALSNKNLSNEQHTKFKSQAQSIRHKLKSAQKSEKSILKDFNKVKKHFHQTNNDSNHIARSLAVTPAVVEVPVYSDYVYQQQTQTNILTGVLYLRANKITRTAAIKVSSEDISHPAHPIINLADNPMLVLNQQQLTPQYNDELFNIGARLINELIAERKSAFLYQAQSASDLEQKFTLLVQHGLITHDVTSTKVANQLNSILINEFGQGGFFNIHQLLHLY